MRSFLLSFLLLTLYYPTWGQAGSNDPTFNTADIGFGAGNGAGNNVLTTSFQADGKIIIGGELASITKRSGSHA